MENNGKNNNRKDGIIQISCTSQRSEVILTLCSFCLMQLKPLQDAIAKKRDAHSSDRTSSNSEWILLELHFLIFIYIYTIFPLRRRS